VKILLVASSGGHLAQLMTLRPWWEKHTRRWITFDTIDARSVLSDEDVAVGFAPTTRNIPNLARNAVMARRELSSFRPDLVISTGAGIAVPYFWLAHRYGARTVYLEVIDRIDSPTMTGRLVYPVTDEFLAQWPEQQGHYPGARLVGPVI
jgi:UDP-N-acetylglucosamine:LPS N-acetylglucosamine transferase